jgi:hypothetical protein
MALDPGILFESMGVMDPVLCYAQMNIECLTTLDV